LSGRLRGLLHRGAHQWLVLSLAGTSALYLYALVSEGGTSFPLFTLVFLGIIPHLHALLLIRAAKVMVEVAISSTRVSDSLEGRENPG
jgi:hypothetical protein